MMKNCVLGIILLSLALLGGCAKGGNGEGSGIAVSVSGASVVGVTLSATYTAAVTGTTNTAVSWSISGTACTGTPNPCGSFTTMTATTATYQAPATAPGPGTITIQATSKADSTVTGDASVNIVPVSVVVTPTASPAVVVGENLTQQFTAVAVPDAAPQTFTWTCSPTAACGGFVPGTNTPGGANNSGVAVYTAVYTAPSTAQTGVQISASWSSTMPETPAGTATSKVSVAATRLIPNSNYVFQFSGYDSSNNAVAVLGTVPIDKDGIIAPGGIEDVFSANGFQQKLAITSASAIYSLTGNNSNNQAVLNLSTGAANIPNTYSAVLTSGGNIQMIEIDTAGTGSGVMQKSATQFNTSAETFAFGFTGIDSTGNRVGYVGILPMTPNANGTGGTISGGMLDTNDNGNASNVCGTSPCTVTGTYVQDTNNASLWHMTLSAGTSALDFDFFVAGGQTQSKTTANPQPLTLYAISTDPVLTNPAVSGSMVYQVPMTSGYNNAAFSGSSVSALTGINPTASNSSNVALINGTTDGTSSGTGGSGGFTGGFDQNNNGTILSVSEFPSATATSNPYSYVASGSSGRYIFQLPVNASASASAAPTPFVLYASGANRGFLLDQSSAAVFTGAMYPQSTANNFYYAPSEMPGTYAASSIPGSTSGVVPFVENLLLTSTGSATYNVTGVENSGSGYESLTGSYTMNSNGTGAITLTSPPLPAVATNVIYAVDATTIPNSLNSSLPNFIITDFFTIGETSGTPSAITFAQQ